MKRVLIVATVAAAMLSSCAPSGPTSLYNWGGTYKGATLYENWTYNAEQSQTPEDFCELICVYELLVSNPGGYRKTPPPGICAEYGYQLLKPNSAAIFKEKANKDQKAFAAKFFKTDDYETFFRKRGEEMLKKEIELYPESAKFIEPLIKKLLQQ